VRTRADRVYFIIEKKMSECDNNIGAYSSTIGLENFLFQLEQLEGEGKSVCALKRDTKEAIQRRIEDYSPVPTQPIRRLRRYHPQER